MVNQIGRPDDGTDTTGFFDMEFFVDLMPKEEWRPVFHQDKDLLIASMDRELEKIPGVFWNFSQPISDNMEEAVSGVKGELAIKIYGDDLKTLEAKGDEIVGRDAEGAGIAGSGTFSRSGPAESESYGGPRQAARYQINVSDVQDAIQTAVGGNALTRFCRASSAMTWCCVIFRIIATRRKPSRISACLSPSGERVSLAQLTEVR